MTVWHFAGRELHEEGHELRVHGRRVALEGRPYEVLRYLLARAGETVTREELMDTVWSGRVVTDGVLSRTVMKLRRALDDPDQRIVTTAHGYGYQLAVPVSTSRSPVAVGPHRYRAMRRRSAFAVTTLVMLSLVAVLAWNRLGTADAPRLALLPVAVEDDGAADWLELGLMGYLATELGRRFEVLSEDKVLSDAEAPAGDAVGALRAAYGPVDVLETSLDRVGEGVHLRFTLHRAGFGPWRGHVNADSPLAAADILLERLHRELDAELDRTTEVALARELFARGRAAMMAGDARAARDYLTACLQEDPNMRWARYELALAQRQLGQVDAARRALEALAEEPGGEPKLAAGAHQALAVLHWRAGRLERAEAGFRRSLEIAGRHGLDGLIPGQLLSLGIVARSRGDHGRARELYLRALHLSRARGDRDTQARVHNSLGVLAWKRGDVDASYREHSRALEIRRELDRPREVAASLNNLATVALVRGRWPETGSLLRQAVTLREELGDGAGLATSKRNLAKLAMLQGRLERAESLALESLRLAGEHGYASREADAFLLAGRIAYLAGKVSTARERYQAAIESYRDIQHSHQVLGARLIAADLPGANPDAALRLAGDVLNNPDLPSHLHGRALMLRAGLRASEAPQEAARDWRRALAISDELGHVELGIQAALDYSAMLIDTGRAPEAAPLMARLGEWPEYAPALRLRARYWEVQGNKARARDLLARADARPESASGDDT